MLLQKNQWYRKLSLKKQPASKKGKAVPIHIVNRTQEFYRSAVVARADGRIPEARYCFEQAIDAGNAEQGVYKDFVQMLVEIGDKEEALNIIRRAINAFPHNNAYFYEQHVLMELEVGNDSEARKILQKGLNQNPSDPGLKRRLAYFDLSAKSAVPNSHQGRPQSQAELVRQSVKQKFNPYVVGKQVTGDKFIGRQDILADLITALKAGNHLIIEGERRIGKTSILYKLVEMLRQDQDYCFIPAYVQLQQVEESELFYAMMRAVAGRVDAVLTSYLRSSVKQSLMSMDLSRPKMICSLLLIHFEKSLSYLCGWSSCWMKEIGYGILPKKCIGACEDGWGQKFRMRFYCWSGVAFHSTKPGIKAPAPGTISSEVRLKSHRFRLPRPSCLLPNLSRIITNMKTRLSFKFLS
ncbi:MAG: hypothetical protein HC875_14420 [Anaerolineales bacterium]|nr:hypothetical protein [Anaerolineales bacterium]